MKKDKEHIKDKNTGTKGYLDKMDKDGNSTPDIWIPDALPVNPGYNIVL